MTGTKIKDLTAYTTPLAADVIPLHKTSDDTDKKVTIANLFLNVPSNGLVVGTNQLVVTGGNVGIGTAAPIHSFEHQNIKSLHVDATEYLSHQIYNYSIPDVNCSASYLSAEIVENYQGTATITGAVIGLRAYAQMNSGLANIVEGIQASARFNSVNVVGGQSLYGVRSNVHNLNVGKVGHMMAFKANSPINSGGGTVEHNWGLYIADQSTVTPAHDGCAIHIEGAGLLSGIGFAGDASDAENSRIYSDSAGYLVINVSALGINTTTRLGILDICNGVIPLVIGADTGAVVRTNNTAKLGILATPHYDNTEEVLSIFSGQSENGYNIVHIGGGTSKNAATYLIFYTAANGITTGGTERMKITDSGTIKIADLAGVGDRAVMAHADGTLYC